LIKRAFLFILLFALAAGGGYYWYTLHYAPVAATAQAPAPAPPPPEVGIVIAQPAEVPFPVEYAGRVAGLRDVEVRPLVSGLLLKREFEEGARVKQGQVLFRIDPATYQVALSRAEAQLHQAQATLRQTEENFKRIEELSRRQVATERQLDEAIAAREQARASVQLAEAEISAAKLNLGYTVVNAPASGVTALQSPPEGTLIQAQQTLLTRITQLDPAYVNFSFTDEEGQAFRALNEKRAKPISEKDLTVELHYANGTVYPQGGRIDIAAQRVDVQTGTIQARAIFPNTDGALLPGQFVRVIIHGVTLPDAIVIPKQAVSQGAQGPSVFVVGENNVAESRPVRLAQELAQGWVVQEGLKGGERVVVDGVIRVRPGAPVRPVPLPTATATTQVPTPGPAPAGGQAAGPRR
jgi:membrane fusion protein (multidrug efflux system)